MDFDTHKSMKKSQEGELLMVLLPWPELQSIVDLMYKIKNVGGKIHALMVSERMHCGHSFHFPNQWPIFSPLYSYGISQRSLAIST